MKNCDTLVRPLRVLIACEFSGVVRRAFCKLGHDAWSCDLIPSEDATDRHIQGDALKAMRDQSWDLIIAHPPCTDLAVSGARWFPAKRASGEQQRSIDFFLACVNAPAPMVAVENPICIMSRLYRKPDQIIQPWWFGHGEVKATCLWLKGLPKLLPTKIVAGREPRVHHASPGPDRWKERSRTLPGIGEGLTHETLHPPSPAMDARPR